MSARKPRIENGCNVKVFVRCRPKNEREGLHESIVKTNLKEVTVNPHTRRVSKKFTFDDVFGVDSTQAQVYKTAIVPVVEEVLKGFNCTVFAYGQTGTGKTYTMEGGVPGSSNSSREHWKPNSIFAGMIPRAIHQIFRALDEHAQIAESAEHVVRVSHLELYKEELIDLLSDEERQHKLFDDGQRGVRITNLEEILVTSADDICRVLEKSSLARHSAATLTNKNSSRSHCIFTITIHMKENTPAGEDVIKIGKLNLVDLAGSENIGRSGAKDERQREAGDINKSLLTLGRVITALTDQTPHVPYRESKLTRLLQESLGGRAKTAIIATISPSAECYEETLSTLEYAHRAKRIKNRPEVNKTMTKRKLINDYETEIERLKNALAAARTKNGVYLPAEQYEEMLRDIKGTAEHASDLDHKLDLKQTEIDELTDANKDLQLSLDNTIAKLQRTKERLTETREKLVDVSNELQGVKQTLSATEAVVEEQTQTELLMQKRYNTLVAELDRCADELSRLHGKLGRHRTVDERNDTAASEFRSTLAEKVRSGEQRIEHLLSSEMAQLSKLSGDFGLFGSESAVAATKVCAAMSEYTQQLNTSLVRVRELSKQHDQCMDSALQGNAETLTTLHEDTVSTMRAHADTVAMTTKAMISLAKQQSDQCSEWRKRHNEAEQHFTNLTTTFVQDHRALMANVRAQIESTLSNGVQRIEQHRASLDSFAMEHAAQSNKRQTELLAQFEAMLAQFVSTHNTEVQRAVKSVNDALRVDSDTLQSSRAAVGSLLHDGDEQTKEYHFEVESHHSTQAEEFVRNVEHVERFVTENGAKVNEWQAASNTCADHILAHTERAKNNVHSEQHRVHEETVKQRTKVCFELQTVSTECSDAGVAVNKALEEQNSLISNRVQQWHEQCEARSNALTVCKNTHTEEARGAESGVHTYLNEVLRVQSEGSTPPRRQVPIERTVIETRPKAVIMQQFISNAPVSPLTLEDVMCSLPIEESTATTSTTTPSATPTTTPTLKKSSETEECDKSESDNAVEAVMERPKMLESSSSMKKESFAITAPPVSTETILSSTLALQPRSGSASVRSSTESLRSIGSFATMGRSSVPRKQRVVEKENDSQQQTTTLPHHSSSATNSSRKTTNVSSTNNSNSTRYQRKPPVPVQNSRRRNLTRR